MKSIETRIAEELAVQEKQVEAAVRLLDENFLAVRQAIAVPRGSNARLDALNRFLDEARSSGFLAQAIARAGLAGVDVAPKP